MKLIPLTILLTSLAVDAIAQKFRQEQYPFPPQFPGPSQGVFASDNTLYLPPESHTPLPYFPMKNQNLQYPYLPPTATKAPAMYPSPFPFIMSTTLLPNFEEDEDDDNRNHNMIRKPPPPSPPKMNQTMQKAPEPMRENRELREIRGLQQLPFHQAMDRIDVKVPTMQNFKYPGSSSTPAPPSQTPATRRMIISAETQKSDMGMDQIKAASYHGSQFLQSSGGIYIPPSTTEPAIPIIRLSNEMDLDGSFSYEALGADQTHYVQHSRMENFGPDNKQEQVVEGSYSYVGDNGQTYTVHYIADSNGFRASGDHLPVAPPMPEIIQRAVQYNLAEEAKRPPHLKSWQDDGRNNEIRDSEQNKNFAPPPPPPRNLFTGRTPEAFSYSYNSQGSNPQNNLITSASNQVKTVDYTTEQPKAKQNNGPISPQITFLASQGAHVPAANSIQDTISRMFTNEKPVMPQIVNYEAGVKDSEPEASKGLWRWQYGLTSNNLNQNPIKETISRSSPDDDIMINFSDMTPEQYTKMIRQLEPNQQPIAAQQYVPNPVVPQVQDTQNNYLAKSFQNEQATLQLTSEKDSENIFANYYHNQQAKLQRASENQNSLVNNVYTVAPENKPLPSTTEKVERTTFATTEDWSKVNYNFNQQIPQFPTTVKPIESRDPRPATPRLITHRDFVNPTMPTQTVTQSYNFEDTYYEPRKLRTISTVPSTMFETHVYQAESKPTFEKGVSTSSPWANIIASEIKTTTTQQPPEISSVPGFKFTDFIRQESKSDFKPITTTTEAPREIETTTTEKPEDMIENNIFLKSLFKPQETNTFEQNMFTPQEPEEEENKVEVIRHESKVSSSHNDVQMSNIQNQYNDPSIQLDEPKKNEIKLQNFNQIESQTKLEAESKTDKVTKIVPYRPKSVHEIKSFKKKPMDISDILNYVSLKNQFESNKMKPKAKGNNNDNRNEIRFIPILQDNTENINMYETKQNNFKTFNIEPEQKDLKPLNLQQEQKAINFEQDHKTSKLRTLNYEPDEVRGNIKNYKVLHRNNNINKFDGSTELKTELSPPPLKAPNMPPLGRAGPSMKSYLPPIYV